MDSDEPAGSVLAGCRGSAASGRLKEAMRKHQGALCEEIQRRAAEALDDAGAVDAPDLMLRYLSEEVPVQQQRAMGYLLCGLGHVHKAMKEGRQREAELLVLRLIAAGDQCCFDTTWKTAWGLTGLPEPSWNRWSQVDAAGLRKAHGASRLVPEQWISVEVQRLKDIQFLVKQRPGGYGSGGGGGGGAEAKGGKGGGRGSGDS